jgi:uncharacterized protein (TIGR03086 family)
MTSAPPHRHTCMSEIADRYRRIASQFTDRVRNVPPDAWGNPAPCEGWVARDVVRHLVDWLPAFFFEQWGIERRPAPSVDDDPLAAWLAVDEAIQAALDDPEVAGSRRQTRMGESSLAETMDMIGTSDVLLHTWDLARATGLDERLDPEEVHNLFVGMEPYDEMLRSSGQYGPRVAVPDDADEQTKLIAFIGRQP